VPVLVCFNQPNYKRAFNKLRVLSLIISSPD